MLLILYVILKIRYPETGCRYRERPDMAQFNVGDTVDRHDLVTIHGKPVCLPDPERLVHLQFRRYAGRPWACPRTS